MASDIGMRIESAYLGSAALRVSRLCLGAMNFGNRAWGCDEDESLRIIDAYLERGGNFIDTANSYADGRSEEIVGRALKGRRQHVVLATKVFNRTGPGANEMGYSRPNIQMALEASLRRLQTDVIDLYYFHHWDPGASLVEMLRTMNDLVRRGLVRYAACSNFTAAQIVEAAYLCDRFGWEPLVCLQPQYNLLARDIEAEILPVARRFGIGIVPWGPLAGGVLSGKYDRDRPPPPDSRLGAPEPDPRRRAARERALNQHAFAVVDAVKHVANAVGASSASVSLAWLLEQPGVTAPIVGPRSVSQLKENLTALDVRLTSEQRAMLDAASRPLLPYPYSMEGPIGESRQREG